jgi:hypothetical protein
MMSDAETMREANAWREKQAKRIVRHARHDYDREYRFPRNSQLWWRQPARRARWDRLLLALRLRGGIRIESAEGVRFGYTNVRLPTQLDAATHPTLSLVASIRAALRARHH